MSSPPSQPDADPPTLQELAARSLSGDRRAFDVAVRRLSVGLERVMGKRTRGDPNLTQELCQQAWSEVWGAMVARRYDPGKSAFSTFAYAVAHKVWLRHLRSAGRTVPEEWSAFVSDVETPTEALDDAAEIEAVRACLRGDLGDLTDDERWILRASAGGVSDRELGARLGIAPSSANARKQSALRKLRACLRDLGPKPESTERVAEERRERGVRPQHRKEGEHG